MTLDDARRYLWHAVIYTPRSGMAEAGVITAVRDPWVFVMYDGDRQSKATAPEQLTVAFHD